MNLTNPTYAEMVEWFESRDTDYWNARSHPGWSPKYEWEVLHDLVRRTDAIRLCAEEPTYIDGLSDGLRESIEECAGLYDYDANAAPGTDLLDATIKRARALWLANRNPRQARNYTAAQRPFVRQAINALGY